MPPVSPQGSRGGLIAAVVIFTIWSVAATIFAIYNTVALSKAQDQAKAMAAKDSIYYIDTTSEEISTIATNRNMVSDADLHDHSVLTIAVHYMDQLAQAIEKNAGATTNPTVVVDDAHQALANATSKLKGLTIPADADLVTAINTLADFAGREKVQADSIAQAHTDETNMIDKQMEAASLANKKLQDMVDQLTAKTNALQEQAQKADEKSQKTFAQGTQEQEQAYQQMLARLKTDETLVASKDKQIADVQGKLDQAMTKKAFHRPDPAAGMMSHTEAQVSTVASDGVVYIDVGGRDHVVPGMTFEVFDQREGVPAAFDPMSDEQMPVGLGSIEVEHVDPNASQCRVIRLGPAGHIDKGDPIANLVYDRNTKYNFVVYGKFDLAHSGRPNETDAKKIEALITQWGGAVQSELNVNTDFVVMGVEPKVETFTPDELQVPFAAKTLAAEQQALKDYLALLDKARELHIPPMNQNRFLYLIGYYDAAQR